MSQMESTSIANNKLYTKHILGAKGYLKFQNLIVVFAGILAQETPEGVLSNSGKSYIAASYVKYIESAGGRVVPIRYPFALCFIKFVVSEY